MSHVQHQGTLNKVIKRINRDANFEVFDKKLTIKDLLPDFGCHTVWHTIGLGMNGKVIQ